MLKATTDEIRWAKQLGRRCYDLLTPATKAAWTEIDKLEQKRGTRIAPALVKKICKRRKASMRAVMLLRQTSLSAGGMLEMARSMKAIEAGGRSEIDAARVIGGNLAMGIATPEAIDAPEGTN